MKYQKWLGLACGLALLCTGCSLDVEPLLQPPKVEGEQRAVQEALETYVYDTMGAGTRHTPEYPLEGAHTSAFLLCDDRGYPVQEQQEPSVALAFYSLPTEKGTPRINLLHRSGEDWVSVADIAGPGADLRQVAFGDLDGDGNAELIAGWTGYSDLSQLLTVYTLTDGFTPVAKDKTYTAFFVGDVTASGHDSLLRLQVYGNEMVTATLEELQGTQLKSRGTVSLDGGIQQFGGMTLCRLAEGVHGLYLEGYKSGSSTVTELIYYDSEGLHAPFYDAATNTTAVTTRPIRLAARDVDGDAIVEIPVTEPLPGHTLDEVGGSVTLWRQWDYTTRTWQERTRTLVNDTDGYLVVLGDTTPDTAYDPDTHTLTLRDTAVDSGWLWLTVGKPLPQAPAKGLKSLKLFRSDAPCYVWYDPERLEAEKVRYMVTQLTTEGG